MSEPSLEVLPDGKLICVMRSGTYVARKKIETYCDLSMTSVVAGEYTVSTGEPTLPIYQAISTDGGATWEDLHLLAEAWGACPRLLLLNNGVLALGFGRLYRPKQGNAIVFSIDGGQTWTNQSLISPSLSSGYTDMIETSPGTILYMFDTVTSDPIGDRIAGNFTTAVDIKVTVA